MPKINCRHCKKELVYNTIHDIPTFPFCSETCKLVDLGEWFNGEQRIESPITNEAIEKYENDK